MVISDGLCVDRDCVDALGFDQSKVYDYSIQLQPLNENDALEEVTEEIVQSTRSVRESIRNFPVYYLLHPSTPIVFLTTLHQLSTSIFRKMAPYILFIKFNIDSYSSPNIYTFVNLLSLILEFLLNYQWKTCYVNNKFNFAHSKRGY